MRIMYLTQWFDPEPNVIKGVAFARALEAGGHEVTVVTGLPNYPTGQIYPGYRVRLVQSETMGSIRIVRLPLYPSHDDSSFRRSLNFLSFFLSAPVRCLLRGGGYDLAYVYHPPITTGLAAALAGLVRRLPFVLDVQDLWPDTIATSHMAGTRWLARPISACCRLVYRRAGAIVVQSEGMRQVLIARGVDAAKVTTIRNWAAGEFATATAPASPADERKRFAIVYGGNLGRAQGLDAVIEAAALAGTRRPEIEVHLYGDGIDAERLRQQAHGVPSVRICPPVPQMAIAGIFASADALLLHIRDEPLFAITIPSKTQAYLASGRPIIAGIAGETAALLAESGAAIVVPPQDPEALADAFCQMASVPPAERWQMGEAGRRYYRENFSFEHAVARTLALIAELPGIASGRQEAIAA